MTSTLPDVVIASAMHTLFKELVLELYPVM